MKLLYITNLFPIASSKILGIFVTKRLEAVRKNGIEFVAFATAFEDTYFVKLLMKMLLGTTAVPVSVGDIVFHSIPVRRGVCDILRLEAIGFFSNKMYQKFRSDFASVAADSIAEELRQRGFLPDIIHAHGMYRIGAGIIGMHLSRRLNIPYVVTLHGTDVNYKMRKVLGLSIEVLEGASAAIFVSDALRKRAVRYGYSGRNATVIPNGYDPEIFYPMDKEEVRKELGVYGKDTRYVGFVGSLIPVKRADKLPEIFRLIASEVKNVKFIVVGDGRLRKRIEKAMRDLDVIFTGTIPQEEVAKWMNAMDVMVLPSREEGFGAVAIEAQACGTAVVGSNVGGIPEAIGFKEFVVEEGENFEERFANRVIHVLRDGYDSRKLVERAKSFTWENIVKREINVYKEVLHEGSHNLCR